jgi:hypothetical protein
VFDWPKQLAGLLDDANAVLGPTLHARFVLVDTGIWVPRTGEEDLAALVDELAASDSGDTSEWIVGLAGSVPRAELSFHELGRARLNSKHLVMRAMNDASEFAAIEQGLSRLDERERIALYRARKRHKAATVFLHEFAHTLGVPHELDPTTIMARRYAPSVDGYSAAATEILRLSLAHRLDPGQSEQAYAGALSAHLRVTWASWVPEERDELLARLLAEPLVVGAGHPELALLVNGDLATFRLALHHEHAGRLGEAWTVAKPLFDAYREVYPVQDLRCRLALGLGGPLTRINEECAQLMRLTLPGKRR